MAKDVTENGNCGLTDRQIRFCHAYAETLHAGDAYAAAGYRCANRNSRDSSASKLLRNPKIRGYLCDVLRLNQVEVANAFAAIAFTPITELIRWDGSEILVRQTDQWSEEAKLAVRKFKAKPILNKQGELLGFQVEVEMYDRLQALDKLADKLKMFEAENLSADHQDNQVREDQASRLFSEITGTSLSP